MPCDYLFTFAFNLADDRLAVAMIRWHCASLASAVESASTDEPKLTRKRRTRAEALARWLRPAPSF